MNESVYAGVRGASVNLHGDVLLLRVDPQIASKLQAAAVEVDVVETQLCPIEHIGCEADTAAEFLGRRFDHA